MKPTQPNLIPMALAMITAAALTTSANASFVTFQNSVAITDTSALDAPLSFAGATLIEAQTFGWPPTAQTVSTVGGQTINFTGANPTWGGPSGTASTLYRAGGENNADLFAGTTGDAGFDGVLDSQGWCNTGSSLSPSGLRLGNLTAGNSYVALLLASDMRSGSAGRTQQYHDTENFSGSASDSFSVQGPTYVLAAFVADANGYQDIFIKDTRGSGWDTTFAGFTLYSVTSVPEPTSAAMLGLGSLVSLMIYRRRK
jgi:hypothetical protein